QALCRQRKVCPERDHLLHHGAGCSAGYDALQPKGRLRGSSMKNKKEKQNDLEKLREQLAASKNLFLTGYEKMTVGQDFELRKTVRGAGGNYKVIKNRIAEKAAEGGQAGDLLKELKGMCAIAYTSGDPVALAKALTA